MAAEHTKAYQTTLEKHVEEMRAENVRLREENERLRGENDRIRCVIQDNGISLAAASVFNVARDYVQGYRLRRQGRR